MAQHVNVPLADLAAVQQHDAAAGPAHHDPAQVVFLDGGVAEAAVQGQPTGGKQQHVCIETLQHIFGVVPHVGHGFVDHLTAGAEMLDAHASQRHRGLGAVGDDDQVLVLGEVRQHRKGAGGAVHHDYAAVVDQGGGLPADGHFGLALHLLPYGDGKGLVRRIALGGDAAVGADYQPLVGQPGQVPPHRGLADIKAASQFLDRHGFLV